MTVFFTTSVECRLRRRRCLDDDDVLGDGDRLRDLKEIACRDDTRDAAEGDGVLVAALGREAVCVQVQGLGAVPAAEGDGYLVAAIGDCVFCGPAPCLFCWSTDGIARFCCKFFPQ